MNGAGFRVVRAAALLGVVLVAACQSDPAPEPLPAPPTSVTARPAVAPAPTPTPTPTPTESRPVHRWHAARVIADAPLLPTREITVVPGDTLDAIARANGVAAGALAVANGLAPPYGLVPGAKLTIPAGRSHIVKPGETGIAIARAYHAEFARVARANGLRPPYALEVGDRLLIPMPLPRPSARFAVPPKVKAAEPAALPLSPPPATVEARAQAYNLDIDKLLRGEPQARARPVRHRPPPLAAPSPTPVGEERPSSPSGGGVRTAEGVAAEPIASAIHLDWPLTGRLLSTFGAKPGGRFNDGINIAASEGTPVHAAADGTVIYAGSGVAAFGNLVLIRHAGGWLTAYAHCAALLVAKGDTVRRGQPIARAGATGEVDAPQLHFEVRRGRTPVDPLRLLPVRGSG